MYESHNITHAQNDINIHTEGIFQQSKLQSLKGALTHMKMTHLAMSLRLHKTYEHQAWRDQSSHDLKSTIAVTVKCHTSVSNSPLTLNHREDG